MIKAWSDDAWDEFIYWQQNDGKPERLTGNLSEYHSRRIDGATRIVYKIENDIIKIIQCGSHYRDK